MTLALVLFLLATLTPAFFGRVSAAPLWLGLQALTAGWISLHHADSSWHTIAIGAEILLVRGLLVPRLLRRALRRQPDAETHASLMPTNLFTWGIAIGLVIFAFQFGDGARADSRAMTMGAVATTITIAFLMLATNHRRTAQLVALLFMENALVLLESLQPHAWPLPVHLSLSAVYVLTVLVACWLVLEPPQTDQKPFAGDTL